MLLTTVTSTVPPSAAYSPRARGIREKIRNTCAIDAIVSSFTKYVAESIIPNGAGKLQVGGHYSTFPATKVQAEVS
jgi:hypothetical protein